MCVFTAPFLLLVSFQILKHIVFLGLVQNRPELPGLNQTIYTDGEKNVMARQHLHCRAHTRARLASCIGWCFPVAEQVQRVAAEQKGERERRRGGGEKEEEEGKI